MAYDSFKIQYLFEIYPNINFEDEFVSSQTVQELPNSSDIQQTETKWGDIRSNIKRSRKIQSIIFQNYEVKIQVSRNIGFPVLTYADYVELTTQAGETFLIYDVEVTQTKVSGGLGYTILITFKRESDQIIYHGTSDNASTYKTGKVVDVNEIQYDVQNPNYVFNNVNVVATSITGATLAAFTVPFNGLTDTIEIGDTYYLHTDNTAFNEEQDVLGEYLNFAECYDKDADYVYFKCSDDEVNPAFDYDIVSMEINHTPGKYDVAAGVNVIDLTISLVIYTFIEPIYDHISEMIVGNKKPQGIQENKTTIEKDIAKLKVWVKTEELYLIEYLNYAIYSDILVDLKNYDNIIPVQVKGISARKVNENLVDCYEYDITIIYNNKVRNYYS